MKQEVKSLRDFCSQLRSANFDPLLLDTAKKHDNAWPWKSSDRRDDPLPYLQARCTIEETYDYFGEYKRALRNIKEAASEVRPGLLKSVSAVEPHEYPLWKQRILVLLGLAQATYRKGKYDDCLTLLGECAAALKSLSTVARDPAARSLGTWARVHYALRTSPPGTEQAH